MLGSDFHRWVPSQRDLGAGPGWPRSISPGIHFWRSVFQPMPSKVAPTLHKSRGREVHVSAMFPECKRPLHRGWAQKAGTPPVPRNGGPNGPPTGENRRRPLLWPLFRGHEQRLTNVRRYGRWPGPAARRGRRPLLRDRYRRRRVPACRPEPPPAYPRG